MSNMEIVDLSVVNRLQEGREKIKAGWCKWKFHQSFEDGRVEYCARGAVGTRNVYSTEKSNTALKAEDVLCRALKILNPGFGSHYFDPGVRVAEWNNRQESSKPVIKLFDKAIELALADVYGVVELVA